jgi:hypothetical protein
LGLTKKKECVIILIESEVNEMVVEKIAVEFEKRYIANDGKVWRTQIECEQYEELLADPSPLKNLSFFDSEGNPIDIFQLKDIPAFSYLVLTNDIKRYLPTVVKVIVGDPYGCDTSSYSLPTEQGIWYNDWSNAYNGAHGSNGWIRQPSIKSLQCEINNYQRKIKLFQKMRQED